MLFIFEKLTLRDPTHSLESAFQIPTPEEPRPCPTRQQAPGIPGNNPVNPVSARNTDQRSRKVIFMSELEKSEDDTLRLIKKDVLRTLPNCQFMRIPIVQKSLIRLLFLHSFL